MFTGIIESIGVIHRLAPARHGGSSASGPSGAVAIAVAAPAIAAELSVDDSVALNGVCQTVTRREGEVFSVVAVEETLRKTTLGSLREGEEVNLELPLKLQDRLGGHLVLGHVDTTVKIKAFRRDGESWLLSVEIPKEFLRYVIPVGSIALDGISLTIARIEGDTLTSAIIPHTYDHTVVKHYFPGKMINAEFDILGKYIERLTMYGESGRAPGGLTLEHHKELGY